MENEMKDEKHLWIMPKIREFLEKINKIKYDDVVLYMYQPTDAASLGVTRFLFGLLMLFDIPEERGGSDLLIRWGNPSDCHFPLFPFLVVPRFTYVAVLYGVMWLGALGIMLGYKFQLSAICFGSIYWYLILLDKSFWNNHSYLFGVVTILLMGSSANHYFSLDGYLDPLKKNRHVPYWNYFILKFQIFVLYFFAGLKKTDLEWLEGYSMTNLGQHWVFIPFQLFLSPEKIDYLIVHWFGFLLDLTIGFWMLLEFTRPLAMVFCAMFHLMNSRLFSIGMFPYVCIATMPLFCNEDWPRRLKRFFTRRTSEEPLPSSCCIYTQNSYMNCNLNRRVTWKHRLVLVLLICHCSLQVFLPYSHFITKGFNNWTNGLYGYSWDMMIHSWDTEANIVKIVDNNSGEEYFIDSFAYTINNRWNKHGDMCVQYAECLKRNIKDKTLLLGNSEKTELKSMLIEPENISIYVDVWCSMNQRFQQRMFDPNYDLLKANWSPFKPVEWLMPILTEYSNFRETMNTIMQDVYSWSNDSDVLFIADFPGLYLENFIQKDLENVTLTVLEGEVAYEIENNQLEQSMGIKLKKGDSIPIEIGAFHKVHTISSTPSCYMYTFVRTNFTDEDEGIVRPLYSPFPFLEDMKIRSGFFLKMWTHIVASVLQILQNVLHYFLPNFKM